MTSPAAGIGYFLWLRLRWGAIGTLVYLICLAVTAHVVPRFGEPDPILLALCVLTASIAHLLHVFTLGPADFGVKTSGFPAHMFVLPLATRTLSGWPIVYAAASFAMLWMLIVYLVLKPAGYSPPVLWPAAIAATAVGWIQAVSWCPFPTPFARVPAIVFAMGPLVPLGTWATIYPGSVGILGIVIGLCLLWLAMAYGVAIRGIARARCGTESNVNIVPRQVRAAIMSWSIAHGFGRQSFSSSSAAQLWHEIRRNAIYLPGMMTMIGLPLLALNCHAVLNPESNRTMLFGTVQVTPAAMSLLIWFFVPLMLAASLGQGLGKFDLWGKDAIPGFFAIRPMTTTRFVAVKLIAAAVSAMLCWAIVLLLLTVWAMVEASPLNTYHSLVRTAWRELTPQRAVIAVAAVVGIIAVTWRSMATGMWVTLLGRKWLSTAIGVASWVTLTIAVIAGSWLYRNPHVQPYLVRAVPWMLAGFLVGKLVLATWAVGRLRQLQLIDASTTGYLAGGWCAIAGGLVAASSLFISPSWLLVAAVAVIVPLGRLTIAPLALHSNRHRA